MLRRHMRKMLGELEVGVVEAERAARARSRPKKKGKKEDGEMGKKEREGPNGLVRKRAEYLRWKLGPGAYLWAVPLL